MAKAVAQKLGFSYLDSGAIYRALAYLVLKSHLTADNISQISQIIATMKFEFNHGKSLLNGEDVTQLLRQEQVGMMASELARLETVRNALIDYQRQFAQTNNLVTDGRDMATTIFPEAQLKVFLTASVEERALRRLKELQLSDSSVKMEGILQDIILRDKQDSQRTVSPLRFTSAYKLLDSTNLTIDECVRQIILWYNQIV